MFPPSALLDGSHAHYAIVCAQAVSLSHYTMSASVHGMALRARMRTHFVRRQYNIDIIL